MTWSGGSIVMKTVKTVVLISVLCCAGSVSVLAESHTLTMQELQHYKPLKKNEGKALPSLTKAKLSDVHLAKPVKYFDIKRYEITADPLTQKSYVGGWSFDRAAYSKLSNREKKKIRSERPLMSNNPFGATYFLDSPMKEIYNLHYIDMQGKAHTFASRKALLAFLGKIDTPVELHMLLLNRGGEIRYRKVGDLYILRWETVSYEDYDGGDHDCSVSVDHVIIDEWGKTLFSKQIKYKEYRGKKCENLKL